MSFELTECFEEFNKASNPDDLIEKYPVLRVNVLKSKTLTGPEGSVPKVRLSVSDGEYYCHCVIHNENNEYNADSFPVGSVLEITSYKTFRIKGPVFFVLDSFQVIGHQQPNGRPKGLNSGSTVEGEEEDAQKKPDLQQEQPQQPQQQQKPKPKPRVQSNPSGFAPVLPIEGLSPYHNNWSIRARVSNKSDIRTYTNARGEGKLFNVTFVDESGEIRATGFTDQVDRFYDLLKEGQAYYVSKCRVQIAKKQFSTVQNDFELVFDRDTNIELCEDEVDVPQIKYNFTTLTNLANAESGGLVDVIGVLKSISPSEQIISKSSGRPYDKRDVIIVDDSNYSVRTTFWGKSASNFNIPLESVIALKGAKLGDFNGRNLSVLNSTTISVDPDISEAHSLKGWYDGKGRTESFDQLPSAGGSATTNRDDVDRKTIEEVLNEQLGNSDKPDYFTLKAQVGFIKQSPMSYPACTQPDCNKKVTQESSGQWRCEKCNVTMSEPNYRYIISMSVSDHTGSFWLSSFDEVGQLLIGKSASELKAIEEQEHIQFQKILTDSLYKEYVFRCRARQDTYNEQTGVRYQVVKASPVDYAHESSLILKKLTI